MQTSQPTTTTPPASARARYDEEVDLYGRICGGDRSALLECVDRFGSVVYCALLRLTGDVKSTEDLFERAFVSLWRSPVAFDPAHGPMAFQLLRSLLPFARGGGPNPSRAAA